MRVITFLVFFTFIQFSFAHPGVTNDKGCHINSDTGRKHCHKTKEKKSQASKVDKSKKKKLKKKKS